MQKRTYTPEQNARRLKRNSAWQRANPEKMRGYYRTHDLKRHYGLTPAQYDAMFAVQGGVSAICSAPPKDNKKRRLVVDHNHSTNENRGLLCIKCNNTLERLEAIPNWQERAFEYLAKYAGKGSN